MASSQQPDIHFIGVHTRYSSWTSRVEAVLEYFRIPHTSKIVKLSEVKSVSPTGYVPFIECRSLQNTRICDSLAICEFLAESHPELALWPRDRQLRALARSAAAQMHSGFSAIRNSFPTNFLAHYSGNIPISDAAHQEIRQMLSLWDTARKATKERLEALGQPDEGFLFGSFSIADAFFWPVLTRFRSYELPLDSASEEALKWMAKMWNDPVFKGLAHRYHGQATDPESRIPHYDDIFRERDDIKYRVFPEDWTFSISGRQTIEGA
ncbi:GST N-terminal domain-containing protein [Penicillium ucsense]|uniref:GST N-terminal domain-containing protein n=1 Tax=Penicillium ucsense TaxID=2839758 RepID=A0A8J8W0D0_9EURO|nr:GST N-terminal domain-containing protein [Penicillium ucsense]KAF7734839.1 GST N-terminal domain-containing protein [Penicillium ucsense]